MSEKRFRVMDNDSKQLYCIESVDGEMFSMQEIVELLNEQQATIDLQELRLQHLEELLELSENLNKSYREKLIDMNLKMVFDDE